MIKTIYSLEPKYEVNEDFGICVVTLHFQGKKYSGIAEVSPADEDFFSEKVGLNIALSRARIKILKAMTKKAKLIADIKYQMYQEAGKYGAMPSLEIDPTGNFKSKVVKAQNNYKRLQKALKIEKQYLNTYLTNQDKMVERVKIHRERTKSDN